MAWNEDHDLDAPPDGDPDLLAVLEQEVEDAAWRLETEHTLYLLSHRGNRLEPRSGGSRTGSLLTCSGPCKPKSSGAADNPEPSSRQLAPAQPERPTARPCPDAALAPAAPGGPPPGALRGAAPVRPTVVSLAWGFVRTALSVPPLIPLAAASSHPPLLRRAASQPVRR